MKHTDSDFKESLDFVARHYQPEAFSDKRKRQDFISVTGRRHKPAFFSTPRRIAVAAVATALIASASCYLLISYSQKETDATATIREKVNAVSEEAEIKNAIIEFNDSPLSEVVREIENVYGVRISDIPEDEYRLTLRYEGTAPDLVETINDLLEINLKIEDKK